MTAKMRISKTKICKLKEKTKMRDKKIEELWMQLEDVTMVQANDFHKGNPDYEGDIELVLKSAWLHFKAGTDRETIWRWFDENHSRGVAWLMYKLEGE